MKSKSTNSRPTPTPGPRIALDRLQQARIGESLDSARKPNQSNVVGGLQNEGELQPGWVGNHFEFDFCKCICRLQRLNAVLNSLVGVGIPWFLDNQRAVLFYVLAVAVLYSRGQQNKRAT